MSTSVDEGRDLALITQSSRYLADALVITEEMRQEIATLDLDEALNGAGKAEAIRQCMMRAGASLEAMNSAADLCIIHRRRAGAIVASMPRNKGQLSRGNTVLPREDSDEDTPTYSELGLDKMTAQRLQDISRVSESDYREVVAKANEQGKELTVKEVEKIGRRMRQAAAKPEWSANEEFPGSAVLIQCEAIPFLSGFAPESVDMLLTDPPYSTDVEDIESFARSWLTLGLSRVKSTGRAYVFIGAYPTELDAYLSAFYRAGSEAASHRMTLAMVLPWVYRNTLGPGTAENYKLNWQACLYFTGLNVAPLNSEVLSEKFSVQDFNAPDGRHGIRLHPWEKPADLAERFIRHATMPGNVVIDPFSGTGTFLAAAARLGRNASGCEVDPAMIQFCKQRGIDVNEK